MSAGLFALALVIPLVVAVPAPWAQPADSKVAQLFKRDAPSPTDPNFASYYPAPGATPQNIPAAWLAALNTISLPNFTQSTQNNGYPTYANGESGGDSNICSFTYGCVASDDLYNPPDNIFALTFDDGPTSVSGGLYDFLESNGISDKATHFMIGGNIVYKATEAVTAFDNGGHIACHTWSHPYMTTLSNEQVVAELGWTLQIISDLTGGRIPLFWRPPYGDVDNRVRAIAKGVFGLETVVWNHDSADWAIGTPGSTYTIPSVEKSMNSWLTGSKSPGILALEHELNSNTVTVFETEYPVMVSNGWTVLSIPDAFGMQWYQNAADNNGSVTSMSVGGTAAATATETVSFSASLETVSGSVFSVFPSGNVTATVTVATSSVSSSSMATATTSSIPPSSTSLAPVTSSVTNAGLAASASPSKSAAGLTIATIIPTSWLAAGAISVLATMLSL